MARNRPYLPARRAWLRLASVVAPIALAGVMALVPATSSAETSRMQSGRMAISAGVLNALAVHSGALTPAKGASNVVILGNVKASNNGTSPVNEVPIAANPTNSLQLESGGNDYNCGTVQGFYNSDDGGATWPHQHCLPALAGLEGFGDPNVAYNAKFGDAWILGIDANSSVLNGKIVYQTSSNNGVSWNTLKTAVSATFAGGLTDKEWTEVDNTSTSPFYGCVYISITEFNSSFSQDQISVSHSCDNGTTWSTTFPGAVQNLSVGVDQFSDLAVGNDGTVYATWMHCPPTGPTSDCGGTLASMMFSKSTNGGSTWSAPTVIHTTTLAPDSCGAFYGCIPGSGERVSNIPVIDVNAGMNLYVADYNYTGGKMQGRVSSSTNGGTSWGSPVVVCPTCTGDQFFNWLSVNDANGRIGVTYGNNTSGTSYGWNVAVSLNGGATWKGNKAISTGTSNFNSDGFFGGFIGDYSGNIWTGNALHASWPDTRTGVSQDETGGVSF